MATDHTTAAAILEQLQSPDAVIRRQALGGLRQMESAIKACMKKIERFIRTVEALEARQPTGAHHRQQLETCMAEEQQTIEALVYRRDELNCRRKSLERELQTLREQATRQRVKQSKRARRYNRSTYLAKHHQRKYIRARDKHAIVEADMVQKHASLEATEIDLFNTTDSLARLQREVALHRQQHADLHASLLEEQECLVYLREGAAFWARFGDNEAQTLLQIARCVRYDYNDYRLRDDLVQVCARYSQQEAYGAAKWDHVVVKYECTQCGVASIGWPESPDLCCDACYHRSWRSVGTALAGYFSSQQPSRDLIAGLQQQHRKQA